MDRPTASWESFDALFDRYQGHVAAYVRRRAPESVVEDVVAETFLVAWRLLDRVGPEPLPWLYGVARRVLANEARGASRRGRLIGRLARERDSAQPRLVAADVSEPVRSVLLGLGEREREALLLVAWEGLTPQQGALATGCSSATFRARLHRARRRVTRELTATAPSEGTLIAKEARGG